MPALTHTSRESPTKGVTVASDLWMRKAVRTRGSALFAVANAVAWATMFFVAKNPRWHRTVWENLALALFFFGVALLSLLYARRLARAGLFVSADGVTIRGPLFTRTVSLADAQSFVPGIQPSFGNGTPCPMLERKGGHALGVWALGREGFISGYSKYLEDLQPLCDQLNELIRSAQMASVHSADH
jgi:hypothetical protein